MPTALRTPGPPLLLILLNVLIPFLAAPPLVPAVAAEPVAPVELVAGAVRARVGDAARVTVNRSDAGWTLGVAVLPAPAITGRYPLGWLFLAREVGATVELSLEGDAGFRATARRAAVLSDRERAAFAATEADTGRSTRMRLPFGVGQTWDWGGGPHGWSASPGEPRSAIDLSGGDERVLAARGGVAYSLCTGWTRIIHDDGFASDYYHLRNSVRFDGTPVEEGAYLGDTGTDVTCGGAALGRHVHFALRRDDSYQGVDGYEIGKWIITAGRAQYQGTALHGSAKAVSGGELTNFGALGENEAIVDAYDNIGVNRRNGPGTDNAIVGSVADGATVTVQRIATGDALTGRRGTTDAWSELADGTWVSNAFLWTGATPG